MCVLMYSTIMNIYVVVTFLYPKTKEKQKLPEGEHQEKSIIPSVKVFRFPPTLMQIPKYLPTLFYHYPPHEISPLIFLGVEMDIL